MDIEQILDKLGDKLYNYLTIKLSSPQDAEDVLQEVFYRVLKYRVRLKFKRNPSSYLFQIARNEAVNHIKKRKKDLLPFKGKAYSCHSEEPQRRCTNEFYGN
ncbi:MAG: RNA polymerase sigma factor [Acidobacteriota bacterium]